MTTTNIFSVRSSPVRQFSKKLPSDPDLIRPKLASVVIQSCPCSSLPLGFLTFRRRRGDVSSSNVCCVLCEDEYLVVVVVSLLIGDKVLHLHFHSKQSASTPKKKNNTIIMSGVPLKKLTLRHISVNEMERPCNKDN